MIGIGFGFETQCSGEGFAWLNCLHWRGFNVFLKCCNRRQGLKWQAIHGHENILKAKIMLAGVFVS